jgi:hypothetical protein
MAQWADYAITAVHYENDSIASVKRSKLDANNNMTDEKVRTKQAIVNAIQNNNVTYATYSKKTQNRPRVRVVTSSTGKPFLRSDSDNTTKDNLGDLPTF